MHVLVTGATGFLGGRTVGALLSRGSRVTALGRDPVKLAGLQAQGAITMAHDLSFGPPDLTQFAEVDALVHCAALSSPWGRMRDFEAANVTGTQSAITAARTLGVRRFVHVSSPSVYFRFAHQFGVRESDPLPRPVNAYAATKVASERLVLSAPDLNPVILRPRGLYGRGDTALLPRLVEAARHGPLPRLNGGKTVTDLTHVSDVAAAILAALDARNDCTGRVFNISGGEALNVYDVAEAAARSAGVTVRWRQLPTALALTYARSAEAVARLRPGQPEPPVTAYGVGLFAYSQTLDISAAREVLGWQPRMEFETGLRETFGGAPCD